MLVNKLSHYLGQRRSWALLHVSQRLALPDSQPLHHHKADRILLGALTEIPVPGAECTCSSNCSWAEQTRNTKKTGEKKSPWGNSPCFCRHKRSVVCLYGQRELWNQPHNPKLEKTPFWLLLQMLLPVSVPLEHTRLTTSGSLLQGGKAASPSSQGQTYSPEDKIHLPSPRRAVWRETMQIPYLGQPGCILTGLNIPLWGRKG